jgi:hypothetical protein
MKPPSLPAASSRRGSPNPQSEIFNHQFRLLATNS